MPPRFAPEAGAAQDDLARPLLHHLSVAGQHIDKKFAQGCGVLPERGLQGALEKRLPITPATCRTVAKEDCPTGFLHQHCPRYHVPQPRPADNGPLKGATRGIGQFVSNAASRPSIRLQDLGPTVHAILPQSPERHAGEARASRDLSASHLQRHVITVGSPTLMRPKDRSSWPLPRDGDNPEYWHPPKAQAHRDGKGRQTGR